MSVLIEFSIAFGFASAAAWLGAVIITPIAPDSYWDRQPPEVRRRYKIGAWLNASGALLAALSIGLQAYANWLAQ